MNNRFHIIRFVLMLWLLCGLGHTAAFAYVCQQDEQSKYWGYQPVYNSARSMPACEFRPTSTYINSSVYVCSPDVSGANRMPICQFRSTSVYVGSLGETASFNPIPRNGGLRKVYPWDDEPDEDDDPAGVIPDEPKVPLGDTPWLFILLLAGYFAIIRRKKQQN